MANLSSAFTSAGMSIPSTALFFFCSLASIFALEWLYPKKKKRVANAIECIVVIIITLFMGMPAAALQNCVDQN